MLKFLISLVLLATSVIAEELTPLQYDIFEGERRSQIDWANLDHDAYLSFENWKKKQELDFDQQTERSLNRREQMGLVFGCFGTCYNYRELGRHGLRFKSKLYEGDQIETDAASHLWIFLMDGSLLRLGPHSSITLREINLLTNETFYSLRLNRGHGFMLTREDYLLIESNLAETDQLFLPNRLVEANNIEGNTYNPAEPSSKQTKQLNKLLQNKNIKVERATKNNKYNKS